MSALPPKHASRRWNERIFSGPAALSRPSDASLRSGSTASGRTERHAQRTESSTSHPAVPSPKKRLTTLNEVWDAMMEAPEQPDQSERESSVHQRVPHVQANGANIWSEFNTHASTLENDLQKLHDAVQGLGSSLDLAHSARKMRECLALVSWLVHENATDLFPLAVKSVEPPLVDDEIYATESNHPPSWPPAAVSSTKAIAHSKIGTIHDQLMGLGQSVGNLRNALEQFPEFDNFGKGPLKCFENDLKYWSSCLEEYDDHYDKYEVKTYVHDLSAELGKRFREISRYITDYVAYVPNVRLSQQHAMSNLHTLATIATFFSAVTATTIQYTVGNAETEALSKAVLGLWFTSLVFSIASALNSSLALMWRSATYSAPEMRIPLWLWIWIRRCPTVFLLVSVVTFLAGLGCFAVASQPRVIWIIVLVCEGISSFTLAALLILLAVDKWSSYRLQRLQNPKGSPTPLSQLFREKTGYVLPTHIEHTASWSIGYLSRAAGALTSGIRQFRLIQPRHVTQPKPPPNDDHPPPKSDDPPPVQHNKSPSRRSSSLPPMQQLWRKTIRKVILISRATQADTQWGLLESDRMTALESHLRSISTIEEGTIQHEAGRATSDLRFHPEGDLLAICGKRLNMLCRIGSSEKEYLRHNIGQARQVIWSSCGDYLLTRTNRAVHVWTLSGEFRKKTITRYESSGFILPVPILKGNALPRFLSVEGNNMNKISLIDVSGEEHMTCDLEGISIQHADVVPDGSCLLLAASVSQDQQGLSPMKASRARKLMVFNLESREVEHDVPLWHEVQHVTISGNGQMAVVTYKGYPPPQLWFLQRTKDGIRLSLDRQFCAREHGATEFDPTRQIHFSGKGHFLHNDRFILCTTTVSPLEGKIHFWRRDRSDPVHIIGSLTADQDKPLQIACNRASEDFMFATRSQDGTIRIWKAREISTAAVGENTLGLMTSGDPLMLTESPLRWSLPELSEEPEGTSEPPVTNEQILPVCSTDTNCL